MKKPFITSLILLLLLASTNTHACDVCGCSLGGNYFGILPQFNKNFVGLRWSQAKFYAHMNHDSQYLGEEYSNDTYNKVELWGRFYVSKRIQVFAFVPYSFNNMNGTEQKIKTHGLGDITLLSNIMLLNTGESKTSKFKHTLMAGGGIKLPTGKNNLEDGGLLVNPNFQLGTGSVDFLLSTVYTIRYQKVGFNTEAGYKINTRNNNDYRFGNQFNLSGQFFYWQNVKAFSFLPNAGLHYETAQKHKAGNIEQPNTGGSAVLFTTGIETYSKNFSLGVNYKHPLVQNYNSDAVSSIESRQRWIVSLTYNF
ncbi:MAG: hypothetical protein KF856_11145 [Cyclobacteriaceae bacterium]|nr:hypothetical protein [Cyclobacteriaceae bacterium]